MEPQAHRPLTHPERMSQFEWDFNWGMRNPRSQTEKDSVSCIITARRGSENQAGVGELAHHGK